MRVSGNESYCTPSLGLQPYLSQCTGLLHRSGVLLLAKMRWAHVLRCCETVAEGFRAKPFWIILTAISLSTRSSFVNGYCTCTCMENGENELSEEFGLPL